MKEVKEKNEVSMEEVLELAETYKKLTPSNRLFMVSASGLLLASQSNAKLEDGENYEEAAAG